MKRVILVALIASLVLSLNVMEVAAFDKSSDIKVAWIGKTLNNPWWVHAYDLARAEAAKLGIDLISYLPEEEVDLEKQISMVEAAIQQNVHAIVISASSGEGVIPALKKANEAGITVINFDTAVADQSLVKAFICTDNETQAYRAGKYMCEKLGGKGEVALLEGLLTQSTGVERKAGFMKACAEYPEIKVVATAPAEWRSDLAMDATVNMLTAHPNIKGVFASNDQMAVGMVNGVYAVGKDPKDMILIGFDGILDAVELLDNGELSAFIAVPTLELGEMPVRLAVASVIHPEYEYERIMYGHASLVTRSFEEGFSDESLAEYAARVFPLRGVNKKGY